MIWTSYTNSMGEAVLPGQCGETVLSGQCGKVVLPGQCGEAVLLEPCGEAALPGQCGKAVFGNFPCQDANTSKLLSERHTIRFILFFNLICITTSSSPCSQMILNKRPSNCNGDNKKYQNIQICCIFVRFDKIGNTKWCFVTN